MDGGQTEGDVEMPKLSTQVEARTEGADSEDSSIPMGFDCCHITRKLTQTTTSVRHLHLRPGPVRKSALNSILALELWRLAA